MAKKKTKKKESAAEREVREKNEAWKAHIKRKEAEVEEQKKARKEAEK